MTLVVEPQGVGTGAHSRPRIQLKDMRDYIEKLYKAPTSMISDGEAQLQPTSGGHSRKDEVTDESRRSMPLSD